MAATLARKAVTLLDNSGLIITDRPNRIWGSNFLPGYHALLNLDFPRGVAVVNDRLHEHLLHNGTAGLSTPLSEELAKYNLPFLVGNASGNASGRPASRSAACWIHVTNACNLACDYCYIQKTPERMTEGTAENVVAALKRTATENGLKRLQVSFAGGEPTLNLAMIRRLCSELSTLNTVRVQYSITTNATRVTEELLDLLRNYDFRIYVSLDGVETFNRARHYRDGRSSFADVEYGLETIAKEIGPSRLMVGIVVSPSNVDGLPELTQYLLGRGMQFKYSFYRPNPVATLRNTKNLVSGPSPEWSNFLQTLLQKLRESLAIIRRSAYPGFNPEVVVDKFSVRGEGLAQTCTMGERYFAVGWNGSISRCHMLQREQVVGSASLAADVLKMLKDSGEPPPAIGTQCRECDIVSVCRAGCRLILDTEGKASIFHEVFWEIFPDYVDTIATVQLAVNARTVKG